MYVGGVESGRGTELCNPPSFSSMRATRGLDIFKNLIIHESFKETTQKFQFAFKIKIFQKLLTYHPGLIPPIALRLLFCR